MNKNLDIVCNFKNNNAENPYMRMKHKKKLKCELYNDSMQGWKCYPIQKAQLIIADVPYNVGTNINEKGKMILCVCRGG